jgi:hypothetical protein
MTTRTNRPLVVDRATLVTVLIQIRVKLTASALVIRNDRLAGELAKSVPVNETKAEAR